MKIQGKKIEGANREIIPIPRGEGNDIIFIAEAVLDMEPFTAMCPDPLVPKRNIKGEDIPNFKDKEYLRQVDAHAAKRLAWIVLKSLEATPELEWEKVDLSDPSTWILFREEMKSSGFSDIEINRVVNSVVSVNGLSQEKVDAARERFLHSQQVPDGE